MGSRLAPGILAVCSRLSMVCLLALLAAPVQADDAIAGTLASPKSIRVGPGELATKDGFSAHFWFTSDSHIFLNWIPGSMANLNPVTKVRRETPIYLAVFFSNPGDRIIGTNVMGDDIRISEVIFFYALVRPDGTLRNVFGPSIAWDGATPPSRTVQVADAKPGMKFDKADPPGRYTMHVLVRDDIRKTEIELERSLVLTD